MAPYLSSHLPALCCPPRSLLWPRLSRSPLWSRRRPCSRCSRSKYQPVFSRVRRRNRSALPPPLAPRGSFNGRVDAVFLCCFVLWSSLSLASASLSACSTLLFHAAILAFSAALSLIPRAAGPFSGTEAGASPRETFHPSCTPPGELGIERGDGNREGEHEDHDAPFGPNEPAKAPRPQDGGVDDDQRAEARPPPDTLRPDAGRAAPARRARFVRAGNDILTLVLRRLQPRAPVLFRRGGRIGRRNRGADGPSAAFADVC